MATPTERTAAMDALIADSADMIDAPASADGLVLTTLRDIAIQEQTGEMDAHQRGQADFEYAYDFIILLARQALAQAIREPKP